MDISSLLRDPSPPHNDPRPRSIDALIHPPDNPPPSLLSLLIRPQPSPPQRPILGFDALVHVASEERRRINAASASSLSDDRDNPPVRPRSSSFHPHDSPARHHTFTVPPPLPRHPDSPSPFPDSFRSHRRVRDSPHRSPSPDFRFPFLPGQPTSPSTRLHHSASPINSYPTLRRQHFDSPHSAPAPLAGPVDDARVIPHLSPSSLPHTSPFLPSFHTPPHSSPRNISPHSHSPQHLRSQHYSSPIQSASGSTEPGVLSPRYSHGPKMAGGIELLSYDPSSLRDPPRPDLPNYQSTGRDVFAERVVSDSRAEHPWQETPKLSPLSGKTFSMDEKHHLTTPPSRTEVQETLPPRERPRPVLLHLPLVDVTTMDDGKGMGKKPNFLSQPLHDHRPTRVWEDQPKPRETSRRVSLPHMPAIASGPLEGHAWSAASQSEHDGRSAKEDQAMELPQAVRESARPSLQSIYREPSPPRAPTPASVLSDLPAPIEGTYTHPQLSPPPVQSQSPVQSESQANVPQSLHPNPPTSCAPTLPIPDVHLKDSVLESELQPERLASLVGPGTSISLTSPDPIITGSPILPEPIPDVLGADDVSMAAPLSRHPSPSLAHSVSTTDPGMFELATHPTQASASQSTSRSLSQQPLPVLLPTKDEESAVPEVIPITTPIHLESPCRPLEPEDNCKREIPALEKTMMDVDEELLSLVEDRPLPAVPAVVKVQIDPSSMPGQDTDGDARTAEARLIMVEEKDRASMPPPAARGKKGEKTTSATGTATGSKKKKDGTSKAAAKPKQPPKPRAKPAPKPKVKPTPQDSSSRSIPKNSLIVNARSRSTSVIPGVADDIAPEPEVEDDDKEDDKLYCVCKTRYDEDRTMIACDRCDEWFHTQCVGMSDLEIDLVDQFICPPCIEEHPHLRTTWKQRCLFGLQHENPLSPEACHKPSRGAFSKYCSDDCGLKYMRTRITQWEASGGARDQLWESVKHAAKREGVVVRAETNKANPRMMDVDDDNLGPKPLDSVARRRAEREVARLNARLDEVVKEREFMKRELDMAGWREKVVDLAAERAGRVDECGWDQRLCFGEEEWTDFGSEVLESYEEERTKMDSGEDAMPLDASPAVHGEWWCTGKKKCERHAGWQKLRTAEVSFDKETKEGILLKLTTREREIRKRIEDILFPQLTGTLQASTKRPHPEVQLNGSEKLVGYVSERGKKKT